jgi:peptidoglycan/LPS O-acetylase OafA/YrhL
VDIFFIISGFVITRSIIEAGESFSLAHFYRRRFFRLYPALLVTIFGTLATAWKILSPESFVSLAKSALAASLGISNFYFYFKTGYFDGSADDYPLLHTWSLGVEEQFYLLWPTVLLILPLVFRRALWAGLAFIALASFAAAMFARKDPDLTFYMMPFRVFELAWGAALTALPRVALTAAVRALLGAAGLVLLGVSCFQFDSNTPLPSFLSFVPVLGTTFLILAGAEGVWGAALGAGPLRFIGRISYAVYLVHWPVITLYKTKLVVDPTFSDILWMFGLTVVLALALHVLVENPFRRSPVRILSWALPGRLSAAALCAILALPFAGSAAVLFKNGFPHRIDRAQDTETALSFAGDLCAAGRSRCAFGDTSASNVVYLIGDSHALNLVHGLDAVFKENHIKALAVFDHGCLFLSHTTRFLKGVRDEKCAHHVEEAFEILERDTRPSSSRAATTLIMMPSVRPKPLSPFGTPSTSTMPGSASIWAKVFGDCSRAVEPSSFSSRRIIPASTSRNVCHSLGKRPTASLEAATKHSNMRLSPMALSRRSRKTFPRSRSSTPRQFSARTTHARYKEMGASFLGIKPISRMLAPIS